MIWFLLLALAVPNPKITPGLTRPLSLKIVCSTRWGLDKRFVTEAMKKHVAKAYGVPWEKRAQYEFDHVVPRSLSGADSELNLWPQPLWEAKHLKDPLEVKLGKLVCAGEVSLLEAQTAIRMDWVAAYEKYLGHVPPGLVVK